MKKVNIYLMILGIFIAAAANAGEIGEVDIHGFISQGYFLSDHNNFLVDSEDGSFEINEIGINFSTWVTSDLSLGMQFFAGDLGDVGNDEIRIDYAFADYRYKEWLGFRLGKVKSPGGIYGDTRDIDMLRTCILLPQSVYLDTFREPGIAMKGVEVYGSIDLNSAGIFSYQIITGTLELASDSGVAKNVMKDVIENGINLDIDRFDVDDKFLANLIWETPIEGLRLAVNYDTIEMTTIAHFTQPFFVPGGPPFPMALAGDVLTTDMEIDTLVCSIEYTWGDMIIAFEHYEGDNKQQDITFSSTMGVIPGDPRVMESIGYYGSISYRFNEWFELGAYYSELYGDRHDKDGDRFDDTATGGANEDYRAWNKDLALSTRFDININWLVKLEVHKINGTTAVSYADNLDSAGNYDAEEDWYLYAAKVSYMF